MKTKIKPHCFTLHLVEFTLILFQHNFDQAYYTIQIYKYEN